MRKYLYLLVSLVIICTFLSACVKRQGRKICINKICLWAEIADTQEKRSQGLMFRKGLKADQGMLFLFERQGIYGFWMKNMRFPLDLIWINQDKVIVEIYQNALPCKDLCKSIQPASPVKYVLEVNSGFCREHNLKPRDRIIF